MFFLFEILTLIAALSITSATTIEGHNIVHEENCDEKWKKCAPPQDQNVYVTTSGSLQLMRDIDDEITYDDCSANMEIWCPACKEEGIIKRCEKVDDGYCYIIEHGAKSDPCIIIDTIEREQVLYQVKQQRPALTDMCFRYLCKFDRQILDKMFLDIEDI